jgi:hypothetical protein
MEDIMDITSLSKEDIAKVRHLIDLGVTTKSETKDLNDSFRETLNEVSKDLDLDKRVLRKAVTVAFKATQKGNKDQIVEDEKDVIDEVSLILDSVGR